MPKRELRGLVEVVAGIAEHFADRGGEARDLFRVGDDGVLVELSVHRGGRLIRGFGDEGERLARDGRRLKGADAAAGQDVL